MPTRKSTRRWRDIREGHDARPRQHSPVAQWRAREGGPQCRHRIVGREAEYGATVECTEPRRMNPSAGGGVGQASRPHSRFRIHAAAVIRLDGGASARRFQEVHQP
jgi:hypothetical protein